MLQAIEQYFTKNPIPISCKIWWVTESVKTIIILYPDEPVPEPIVENYELEVEEAKQYDQMMIEKRARSSPPPPTLKSQKSLGGGASLQQQQHPSLAPHNVRRKMKNLFENSISRLQRSLRPPSRWERLRPFCLPPPPNRIRSLCCPFRHSQRSTTVAVCTLWRRSDPFWSEWWVQNERDKFTKNGRKQVQVSDPKCYNPKIVRHLNMRTHNQTSQDLFRDRTLRSVR